MSELIVETTDRCFFCLDQVPALCPVKLEIGHGHGSDSPEYPLHHSLRYLLRYLKMDLKKVFLNDGPIPTTHPHLLDNVANPNLKFKLCENCVCVCLNTNFSKLYRQLEIIQMEIGSCIGLINGKLTNAEQTNKAENFRQNALGHDEDDTDELKAKIKIADVLRIEAVTKCREKLRAITPKVHVRRLTEKQMNEETPNLRTGFLSQVNLDPLAKEDMTVVKMENDPDSGEDGGGSQEWNPQAGGDNDDDMGADDHPHASPTPVSPKPTPIPEECSSIDPGTGRVTCSICFKSFKNNRNFRDHYKNVHVRMRHRCKTCGKVFSQVASLIRHTRTVHKHIKPKCPKCHRSFDWSSQLVEHLKRPSCESTQTSTCKCHICGRVLSNNYMYKHMKRCHFIGP